MLPKFKLYMQDRPASWLKEHPEETWRCDLFPADGSDHHGIGATQAEAVLNAAFAWRRHEKASADDAVRELAGKG